MIILKTPEEVELIRQSGQITASVFAAVKMKSGQVFLQDTWIGLLKKPLSHREFLHFL